MIDLQDPSEIIGGLDNESLFRRRSPAEIQEGNVKIAAAVRSLPEDGSMTKVASALNDANSDMIKIVLRENGFLRSIIPPTTVTEFHPSTRHDQPRVIYIKEPHMVAPRSVPFGTAPVGATYRGHKFEVVFHEIQTPEFIKHIDEFMGYVGTDLRQVCMDNMLRDLSSEEDGRFMSVIDRGVGSIAGVGAAGINQHNAANGPITRASYKNMLSNITDRTLNNGIFLLNRKTANEFLGWDRSEVGGDLAQQLVTEGLTALPKLQIMGIPHLCTIKSSMVPNFHVYQFTEPGYFGKFCTYQDVRVFVKRERDWIKQSALCKVGLTIANAAGMHLTEFEPG